MDTHQRPLGFTKTLKLNVLSLTIDIYYSWKLYVVKERANLPNQQQKNNNKKKLCISKILKGL